MTNNNYAVIMAGGIGSRFWPMSTSRIPKQFLDELGNGETLLQQTFRRVSKICPSSQILIVTNTDYKDICKDQLIFITADNINLPHFGYNIICFHNFFSHSFMAI